MIEKRSAKLRINICCAIRQGSVYARSFFLQVEGLLRRSYDVGSIVVVVDGETLTDVVLLDARKRYDVSFVFEGHHVSAPYFMRERAAAWARAGNLAFDQSLNTPSDYTLWVESDLSFPCDIIDLLAEPMRDIVAPVIMLGDNFYDSWGFRDLRGRRIATLGDLHALPRSAGSLTALNSVGSCVLIRSSLLQQGVRLPASYEDGLLVGLCLAAREQGASVYCRRDAVIVHPTSLWAEQVYRVTSCRVGDERSWKEIAPTAGAIVAGPYFDFVIPEADRLISAARVAARCQTHISFATNDRRELAVLLGNEASLPAPPEGFGDTAPSQPRRRLAKTERVNLPWWSKIFSR